VPRTKSWEALGFPGIPDTNPQVETGTTWLAWQSEQVQRKILGQGRFDLYKAGKLDWGQLVGARADPHYGEMIALRPLRDLVEMFGTPGAGGGLGIPAPELLELGKFETAEDATAWFAQYHPDTMLNLEGMTDAEAINAISRQTDALLREYPQAGASLKGVRIVDLSEEVWAQAVISTGRIELNGKHFIGEGPDSLRRQLVTSVVTKWHPRGGDTIESIITHEFGHFLDDYMWHNNSRSAFTRYVRNSGTGLVTDLVHRLDVLLEAAPRVSEYAKTSREERFAETFTALEHGSGRSKATKVMQKVLQFCEDSQQYAWGEWGARGELGTDGTKFGPMAELIDELFEYEDFLAALYHIVTGGK